MNEGTCMLNGDGTCVCETGFLGIDCSGKIHFSSYLPFQVINTLVLKSFTYVSCLPCGECNVHTAPNHPLFERQDRCSIFSVLCYFRYFVRE